MITMLTGSKLILISAYFLSSWQTTVAHTNFSAIIIGSGPSGIAAATKLLENDFDNFVILEAEDRIGGRVNSVKFGDAVLDLGAEYCHGEDDNVVYQLVKKYDILRSTNRNFDMVYSNGDKIDGDLANELMDFIDLYEVLDRNSTAYSTNIKDFFTSEYEKLVLEKYKNDEQKNKICHDAIGTLEKGVCYLEGCFSWSKPVLNNPYEKCVGDLELNWNGLGYRTVLDVMMKKYPNPEQSLNVDSKIHLSTEVSVIQYDLDGPNNKVTVTCQDGNTYTADHVIFTPSLGVLKETHDDMFVPELPESKQKCVRALGFEAIMKVHLRFTNKWWPGDFIRKVFVWSEEDTNTLLEQFPDGPSKDGKSWIGDVFHVVPVPNNPNVLAVWIIGEFVPDVETAPDEVITNGVMFALNKFLGSTFNLTQPDEILHSSWFTNPHFHGTYSYDTVESLKLPYSCHEVLADTLADENGVPRLLFAGEATNPVHYSTVHGAIETGYREADKILQYYKIL